MLGKRHITSLRNKTAVGVWCEPYGEKTFADFLVNIKNNIMSKSNNIIATNTQETSKTCINMFFLTPLLYSSIPPVTFRLPSCYALLRGFYFHKTASGRPKTESQKNWLWQFAFSEKGLCLKSVSRHLNMKGDYRNSRVLSSPVSKEN